MLMTHPIVAGKGDLFSSIEEVLLDAAKVDVVVATVGEIEEVVATTTL